MGKIIKIILWIVAINFIIGLLALSATFLIGTVKSCSEKNKTEEIAPDEDRKIYHVRDQIIESIKEKQEKSPLKTGVVTLSRGTIAIFGLNGYHYTKEIPESMKKKLKEINEAKMSIDDVCLTDSGYYAIIYNNGKDWYGVLPTETKDRLKQIPKNAKIKSLTVNDRDEYILITSVNNRISTVSSSETYSAFVRHKKKTLGEIVSASLGSSGAVFCFEKGASYCGTIPKGVAEEIKRIDFIPEFIRFDEHNGYMFMSHTQKKNSCALSMFSTKTESVTNEFDPKDFPEKGTVESNEEETPTNNNQGKTGNKENKQSPTQSGQQIYVPVHTPSQHPIQCGPCGGSGLCSNCGGSGISYFGHAHICGACGGGGKCTICGGDGISGYTYY